MAGDQDNHDSDRVDRLLEEIEASRDAFLSAEGTLQEATQLLGRLLEKPPGGQGVPRPNPRASRETRQQPSTLPEAPPLGSPDYLRMIAHDLKEPLRGIAYFCQLLSEDFGHRLEEEGREYLSYIKSATQRMGMLITDAAMLSKLSSQPIEPQPADLQAMVRAHLDELRDAIEAKRGEVRTVGDFPVVECDPRWVQELFNRLFKNAIQYSHAPIEIEVRSDGPHDDQYIFSVRDNGIGIEPQYQDQIFDVFQRLHSWEEYEGTGAGLAICEKIVRLHEGRIWVESQPGLGSTFYFTLPASPRALVK